MPHVCLKRKMTRIYGESFAMSPTMSLEGSDEASVMLASRRIAPRSGALHSFESG